MQRIHLDQNCYNQLGKKKFRLFPFAFTFNEKLSDGRRVNKNNFIHDVH